MNIDLPLMSERNSNFKFMLSAITYQTARLVSRELNIEGPLGPPQNDFKPTILSENLNDAYDTLFISYYTTIFLNTLYPHIFTYTVLPQQFRDHERR